MYLRVGVGRVNVDAEEDQDQLRDPRSDIVHNQNGSKAVEEGRREIAIGRVSNCWEQDKTFQCASFLSFPTRF